VGFGNEVSFVGKLDLEDEDIRINDVFRLMLYTIPVSVSEAIELKSVI
jgi:hypothetical protein